MIHARKYIGDNNSAVVIMDSTNTPGAYDVQRDYDYAGGRWQWAGCTTDTHEGAEIIARALYTEACLAAGIDYTAHPFD